MKIVFVIFISFLLFIITLTFQFVDSNSTKFKLVFCDVGQGDGIYLRAFSQDIVIDGGPLGSAMSECLGRNMPLFDRNIELMVVTHADSDHYAGFLEVLDSYTVSKFATSPGDSSLEAYQSLLAKVKSDGAQIKRLTQGESIKINDEVKIDVLWPPKDFSQIDENRNNSSLVFLINYKNFQAITDGDLDKEYLNLLVHDLSHIEVFKLAHHGSRTGTDEATFEKFRPELSIISAGRNNRFGHPHKEVLEILKKFGLRYLSTQDEGDIVIKTDGDSFEVR